MGPHTVQVAKAQLVFEFTDLVTTLVKIPSTACCESFFWQCGCIDFFGKSPELNVKKYVGVTVPNKLRERLEELPTLLVYPTLL